jgi:DNA mismatch endonuclease (patch repair protein)
MGKSPVSRPNAHRNTADMPAIGQTGLISAFRNDESTTPFTLRATCKSEMIPVNCVGESMADVLSKRKRSQVMAAIRSKGNKDTELKLASIFRAQGIKGWRRHGPLPGKPDFIFPKQRLAVFVDGCFWHGCRWHCRMPQDNGQYWQAKISRNAARDRATTRLLRQTGWRVIRFWQHSLKDSDSVARSIKSELSTAG